MPPTIPPPSRVLTPDGRAVPFDADRVCQALFAATEALGRPDAFLARELGDSAVHFLAHDYEGQLPTTAQVAEVVVKVLRQLGHADLARAFEARADAPAAPPAPYSRDLGDAVARGLLHLDDPDRLSGCALGPPAGGLAAEIALAARVAARVAIDGLDHRALAEGRLAADLAREVRQAGLEAVVNLNTATPPSHAVPLAQGPLFAGAPRATPEQRGAMAEALLSELATGPVRVLWHLAEDDFTGPARERLTRVAHHAPVTFAFDRPRRPVALAEGLDRDHPAALLVAGLGLPALAAQPGLLADAAKFCQRLGSLVRLALSAAVQKRAHLRDRLGAAVTSGFLLDRARFVAVPIGLDEVVRQFTGWGLANGGEALELGQAIVKRLREVLHADGRAPGLAACLDGPFALALRGATTRATVAGLTPWDAAASPRSQLRAAGALHAGEHGVAAVFAPAGEAVACLEQAWRQGDVARVRLVGQAGKPAS